ncbi:NAD(P)/FAD-dependent oxidoreductase [Gluconobacter cerinus]|uniref:Thioredoxin reductase n=2 Tax=Acetobacteraceae TaxID=433 RepID=A0A1B6VGR5_9PROT|nr:MULTISPECIES: NAD(P)/FAD-dependent oxidoreductase [Gluconobacter]OAG73426.1 alkyl hydroperoxide reductase subunit F [Gluconobacter japonicus]MBS1020370.1 NAD(P)/FAD-dependent oxidoreductase [Gluconobacter cerinus]MBS1032773.1 NAD(P)/FAD-dependent oxidoreductase [Gluconobacter cerinus]MBS1036037.1 NAD(P)/FAD-dependent oxidoreductase [Gluconobacter cerinus]MBS1045196.1 NAD(P)/FAD-dependent oxidoreductase [Gluconobacter cerinus]
MSVLLIDAGLPRNRFADASHGFLGQDGKAPNTIMREATAQLRRYPTAQILQNDAQKVARNGKTFTVSLANGAKFQAKRLILATGVSDTLPDIPGVAERWGKTVLHCPYCHGYEVRNHQLGIIATNPMSIHQATLIPDWGPTTYFTQGIYEPDPEQAMLLNKRGVVIERTPIISLIGDAPGLDAVKLADGRLIEVAAVFTVPKTRPASPIAEDLGCILENGPTGPFIKVDTWGATSVSGVYVAGDAASPMHNATVAAASGVLAGIAAHQSLARA